MRPNSFSDIYFSFPSYDDDDESWTQRHIWMECTGKRIRYTECDSDGNHEPIYARDVQHLQKQVDGLWLEYSRWALLHGEDPIGEFIVKHERTIKRNVVVHFSHWIGESEHGLACTSVRWSGGLQNPADLPDGLKGYLCLKKVGDRWCMDGIVKEVLRDSKEVGFLGRDYFKAKAEWKEPISDAVIARQIRRIARKHIARATKVAA